MTNQRPFKRALKLTGELLAHEGLWQASVDECNPVSKTRHGPNTVEVNLGAQAPGVQIKADTGQVACLETSEGKLASPTRAIHSTGGLCTSK